MLPARRAYRLRHQDVVGQRLNREHLRGGSPTVPAQRVGEHERGGAVVGTGIKHPALRAGPRLAQRLAVNDEQDQGPQFELHCLFKRYYTRDDDP